MSIDFDHLMRAWDGDAGLLGLEDAGPLTAQARWRPSLARGWRGGPARRLH